MNRTTPSPCLGDLWKERVQINNLPKRHHISNSIVPTHHTHLATISSPMTDFQRMNTTLCLFSSSSDGKYISPPRAKTPRVDSVCAASPAPSKDPSTEGQCLPFRTSPRHLRRPHRSFWRVICRAATMVGSGNPSEKYPYRANARFERIQLRGT